MHDLAFDPHQFFKHNAPVHSEYAGNGEFTTTGVSFDDYSRMHGGQQSLFRGRRAPPPRWALNDVELREVLVRFLERRAGLLRPQCGSYTERIKRARAKLARRAPFDSALLDRLCRAYVAAKRERRRNAARLRMQEIQIENLDTCLRMVDPLPVVARIVYLYHRCGLDSVQVGTAVHLKPPHIRGLLWRLARVAERLGVEQHPRGLSKDSAKKYSSAVPTAHGPRRTDPSSSYQRNSCDCGPIVIPKYSR